MTYHELLEPIHAFLGCETPDSWIEEAKKPENLPIILTDHLFCELKAAQSALFLIRKYAVDSESAEQLLTWIRPYEAHAYRYEGDITDLHPEKGLRKTLTLKENTAYGQDLLNKMVRLIQEELHHFIQVREQMVARGIPLKSLSAGGYAKALMSQIRTHEPEAFIDKLILGAIIEARSCERFAKLAPHLDSELSHFYVSLLRSEARHYQDYLTLAQSISSENISLRVSQLCDYEKSLIIESDDVFRFHSGQPKPINKDRKCY